MCLMETLMQECTMNFRYYYPTELGSTLPNNAMAKYLLPKQMDR